MNAFDEQRGQFRPYGLTCEWWTPTLMGKPDRHNEIELNYLPEGALTYLLQDRKITVPSGRLTIFWGLIAHQIVDFSSSAPYLVCTLPFSQFLEWGLPPAFVERVLQGEVIWEATAENSIPDRLLISRWVDDAGVPERAAVMVLEMRARLHRLALACSRAPAPHSSAVPLAAPEISQVERLAVYIGRNFRQPIRVADIGHAVGLHPDYANALFKRLPPDADRIHRRGTDRLRQSPIDRNIRPHHGHCVRQRLSVHQPVQCGLSEDQRLYSARLPQTLRRLTGA
ncbi:hypothetical protein [Neolewinella xylanilytica]|nr:hypothetical protein [Neolewinella xylanilytica]